MMRWLVLIAILLFIAGQLTRLRPSSRDKQLQALRQAATRAGLHVAFWTARNSGYTLRQLPASGFMYQLAWPPKSAVPPGWAIWVSAEGEFIALESPVPAEARAALQGFRERFADGWALFECTEQGLRLLWQEILSKVRTTGGRKRSCHRLLQIIFALPLS